MEEINALDMFRTPEEANASYLYHFNTDNVISVIYSNGVLTVQTNTPEFKQELL